MAEDLDLDLNLDNEEQNINNNRAQKRFTDLSEKVKLTAQERDDLAKAKAEADVKAEKAEKERDFYKDFSTSSAKYPGATDYQDKILEKVKSGYTVEDATVSVLNAEGKLTTPQAPRESPAGGSATNSMKGEGEKTIAEMTQAERRAILEKELS
jgi:hypothetical protein